MFGAQPSIGAPVVASKAAMFVRGSVAGPAPPLSPIAVNVPPTTTMFPTWTTAWTTPFVPQAASAVELGIAGADEQTTSAVATAPAAPSARKRPPNLLVGLAGTPSSIGAAHDATPGLRTVFRPSRAGYQ